MKVALLEPNFRICGPVISLAHLKRGFEDLGHKAEIVALTKSGKASVHWVDSYEDAPLGCGWSPVVPDRVEKQKVAGEVLDEYDLIILSDPRCALPDKYAIKDDTLPNYIQWLAETRTPFSFPLNGNRYDAAAAPFLTDLVQLPNFTGLGVDYGRWTDFRGGDPGDRLSRFAWRNLPLPFAIDSEGPTHLSCDPGVGMTGRMTPNKGQQVAALLPLVGYRGDVQLWGACSKGLGASFSYDVWERLAEAGYEHVWRGGPRKHTPLNPFPWYATWTHPDGEVSNVYYRGNYSGDVPYGSFDVQMSLTNPTFSKIDLEYAVLEGVAAGKKFVLNQNFWDGHLRCAVVDPDIVPSSARMIIKKRREQPERALEAVREAQRLTDDDLLWNFDYVKRTYSPRRSAAAYIEGLVH